MRQLLVKKHMHLLGFEKKAIISHLHPLKTQKFSRHLVLTHVVLNLFYMEH